jgi:S-adenosylmethionine decarboxylase
LYFEGPEKKLEVYSYNSNFLKFPDAFWVELVSACGAEIIKKSETSTCKFFLLSESSLFVWDHKILMITCGRTELINSATLLLKKLGLQSFDHLFFERKNEYFPEYQRSFVLEDFKDLKTMFPTGYGLRFGDKDDHHLNIFEYSKKTNPPDNEKNIEVLMYGVAPELSDRFLNPTDQNKKFLSDILLSFFTEYQIDEHWFDPCGYSMNAVLGDSYGTIHVTPEKDQNYISFELNNIEPNQVLGFLNQIQTKFSPRSCDMIYFDPTSTQALDLEIKPWVVRQKRFQTLKSGYGVSYYHWSAIDVKASSAEDMPI